MVVWKSMSLGAMIINFFSLINVPASIMFSTYPYDFLFLPVIWISQQLLSLLQHLWNSNGLHLLKRTITKNNYTHQHTSLTTFKSMIKLHTPLSHASINKMPTAMLCLRPSWVTPPYKMKLRSLRINQNVTLCNIIIFYCFDTYWWH